MFPLKQVKAHITWGKIITLKDICVDLCEFLSEFYSDFFKIKIQNIIYNARFSFFSYKQVKRKIEAFTFHNINLTNFSKFTKIIKIHKYDTTTQDVLCFYLYF